MFYALLNRSASVRIPVDAGDFRNGRYTAARLSDSPREGRVDSPAFKHWSDGSNRMAGEVAGVPVEVFDLKTVEPGSDSSTVYNRTMVVLHAAELPMFDLRARRGALRWLAKLGLNGMRFDTTTASAADTTTVQAFG